MKRIVFASLFAACILPVGTASADSDDYRDGYWSHSHHAKRDRGNGWHHGWRDWWSRSGDSDTTTTGDETAPVETVDEANDDHVGTDD